MEIWFEAVPSPAGADDARIRSDAARLQRACDAGAARILVPEVVDTGHDAVDAIAFAAEVADKTRTPVGVALVTATRTAAEVAARMAQADARGVDTLLLVGPTSSEQPKVGPSVTEALDAHAEGRNLGVVTIPTRRRDDLDEPERVLQKQRAGARFAVSQILFEAESALRLRRDYIARLSPGETPIPFYYSLAPVRRRTDLHFLASLGVAIPEGTKTRLSEASKSERPALARSILLDVVGTLVEAHAREGLGPFGFCISHVLYDNVDEATRLLEDVLQATTVVA